MKNIILILIGASIVMALLFSCNKGGSNPPADGGDSTNLNDGGGLCSSNNAGGSINAEPDTFGALVSLVSGSTTSWGYTDGVGSSAVFWQPEGITADRGDLYIVDIMTNTIRKIVIATGEVSPVAGENGIAGFNDGTGKSAHFSFLRGIATDGTCLYVTDNHTIRKIVIATAEVTTLAGMYGSPGSTDGLGSAARFRSPEGITIRGNDLYVADWENGTIRKVNIETGEVSTIAGQALVQGSDDWIGTMARFLTPSGITTDGRNLFVAEIFNYTIRKIVIDTGEVTTLAGSAQHPGSTDAIGNVARFNCPQGITFDGTDLFVADSCNATIRKVELATGQVRTLAGKAGVHGVVDGRAWNALFGSASWITVYGGSLYVTDVSTVRRIQLP